MSECGLPGVDFNEVRMHRECCTVMNEGKPLAAAYFAAHHKQGHHAGGQQHL